jgi:hypothetical protein
MVFLLVAMLRLHALAHHEVDVLFFVETCAKTQDVCPEAG